MVLSATDSLGRRYLFKLCSNMATIPLFFVLEAVLPRALGPAAYGNYNFATALFQNFTNFLDLGTSTCLNTALAKRPSEFGLTAFYSRIALAMLLLCLLAGAAMYIPGVGGLLLPDVPLWMALPAAIWAYITWAGRVARGMNDALGITSRSEMVRIGVNLFSALVLLALFFSGILNLPVLFGHQYLTLGLLAGGFLYVLRDSWNPPAKPWRLSAGQRNTYIKEFSRYSLPLFITALCSAIALSGERWMLQFFSGSVEQGYFSLAQKIGVACFLFVTAMTPLLMRELAVAHASSDPKEMARLLDRYAPMVYSVAAWLSCFALVETPAVLQLFGGRQFGEAVLTVQIMALYPIHQGYGQIAGAVFYATGETKRLRNISVIFLVIGLITAWVLLAPEHLGGFHLGAKGLAWKMLLVQAAGVNFMLFACRRAAPFKYVRNLLHQVLCPATLIGLAFLARYGTQSLGNATDLPRFVASGILYTALSLTLTIVFPFALGLRRGEIGAQLQRLRSRAKG